MKSLCALIVAASAALAHSSLAADVARVAVENPRLLMVAAIDSPAGEAYGLLVGRYADGIMKMFDGKTPVYIDVTTERRFAQKGCSRLKLTFWQDGVLLPRETERQKQTVEFGINYCRDGTPPRSLS